MLNMNYIDAVRVKIYGRVQGVYYRASTREKAQSLALRGWVRNLEDGSVELWAEGSPPALADLLAWCAVGPAQAVVERVQEEPVKPKGYGVFEIRP